MPKRLTAAQRARSERHRLITNLLLQGHNQSNIARLLGISRQAVSQILQSEKFSAHKKVQYALRTGKLIKPDKCMTCGERLLLEAHHEDYDKPLDVQWLCKTCHAHRHT